MHDTHEMEYWLPQFADWSFAKKVLKGYTTTVAYLFYTQVELIAVMTGLLAVLSFKAKHV